MDMQETPFPDGWNNYRVTKYSCVVPCKLDDLGIREEDPTDWLMCMGRMGVTGLWITEYKPSIANVFNFQHWQTKILEALMGEHALDALIYALRKKPYPVNNSANHSQMPVDNSEMEGE